MAKKREKLDLESDATVDMKPMMIHEQTEFLEKLIDLIPARFYLPDDTEKKWFQSLNKAEKAIAKRETIENLKKAKRDRLNPEKSALSTLDLQKQKLENEKSGNENDIKPVGFQEDYTYEKVRQRFQEYKRKRGGDSCSEVDHKLNVVEEAVKDLTYGYVKMGSKDDEEYGKNRKKKRVSKAKELEMAMKLEDLKKDPVKGDAVAKKHSWQAAISRASGIKIHDDLKLLKKRIRKEKKRREKNTEKWKERIEGQQKVKVEKQQKRSDNISDRIHEKKMRKIANGEKKLLSHGFESHKREANS